MELVGGDSRYWFLSSSVRQPDNSFGEIYGMGTWEAHIWILSPLEVVKEQRNTECSSHIRR